MEAFKKGIIINSWGVVFAGLKRHWLTPKEVIEYCETGNISCNKDRLVQLYLSLEVSLFEFLELIKKFIEEDGESQIIWNEDSTNQDFSVIPQGYWIFWEIEFLLRIVNAEGGKEKKLHQVAAIHSDFNYPLSWHNFLYFMTPTEGAPPGIDGLYSNLLDYLTSLEISLKKGVPPSSDMAS